MTGDGWRSGQRHPLTQAEEQAIVALLRGGQAVYRVAATVRRSPGAVAKVRDKYGITPLRVSARPDVMPARPTVDEAEYDACRVAEPWIAPEGIAYIERPHGAAWAERVAVASPLELRGCMQAMRAVLGLEEAATGSDMEKALVAERRPAEDLARLYLAALDAR